MSANAFTNSDPRSARPRDGRWSLSATAPTTGINGSHLDIAEATFLALAASNTELAVDGAALGHGLPARMINLVELKSILLHPSTGNAARNAAWRHLVTQSRIHDGQWTIGAVGVAMSALRVMSARLAHQFKADQADVDSDILTGFLESMRTVDLAPPRVITRLCTPAFTATRRALREQMTDRTETLAGDVPMSVPATPADGEPADVLARAVVLGVVSEYEARVIKATRLDGIALADFARDCGRDYFAVARCRSRGEKRLAAAIRKGELSEDCDVIAEAANGVGIDPAKRSPAARR